MFWGVLNNDLIHCFVQLGVPTVEQFHETVWADAGFEDFPYLLTQFLVGDLAAIVCWALGLGRVGGTSQVLIIAGNGIAR